MEQLFSRLRKLKNEIIHRNFMIQDVDKSTNDEYIKLMQEGYKKYGNLTRQFELHTRPTANGTEDKITNINNEFQDYKNMEITGSGINKNYVGAGTIKPKPKKTNKKK